jgi:PadR family transcriptional regulator, regulatory protein AphA
VTDEARASHVSYVILGITALRGPTTSYQLKQYVSESIGYFWPLQHASLYREPKRLESLGLLRSSSEQAGRRRQFFEITDSGLELLRDWIREPVGLAPELRDEALLKLHFGELVEPGSVRELAETQLMERKARLAFFVDLEQRYKDWPDQRHTLETLKAGQAFERGFIAFWREISLHAEDLAPVAPRTTTTSPAPRKYPQ